MLSNDAFRGKTVVITGGGTGLGLEAASGFGRAGARVVLASRSEEHLAAGAERLRGEGSEVFTQTVDVRRPPSIARLREAATEHFGPVDILVNNAAGNFVAPAEELSPAGWKVVIDIALNGVFYCSREFGLGMLERGEGQILNVVATYAWTGGPGTVHSAAAKAGVLALTRTLAVEWGPRGVRCNALCPGLFDSEGARERLWPDAGTQERLSEAVPLRRFGTLGEMADALLWLASPGARYANGEVLTLDGGLWLGRGLFEGPAARDGRTSR